MKKPILYFSEIDLEFHTGIKSKIFEHKNALEEIFSKNVDILYLNKSGFNYLGINYVKDLKIFKYLFLYIYLSKFLYRNRYGLVYMRNPSLGFSFFLTPIFLLSNYIFGIKTIVELPTYPFIYENGYFKKFPLLVFSFVNLNLNSLLGNVNFVCSNNNVRWIFSYEKINNYVNPNSSLLREDHLKFAGELNFVGVSNLNFWHGYEKLIRLISSFEGNTSFNFFIFSYSNDYSLKLRDYISNSNINNVYLYLDYSYDQMLPFFEKSHVFVDSLDRYSDAKISNFSLKSRFYSSLGLPFISSNNDPIFTNIDFVFEFNGDSNLQDIVKWYNSIVMSPIQIKNYSQEKLNIVTHWGCILKKYEIFK